MLRKVLGKACNFEPQRPKANSRRDFGSFPPTFRDGCFTTFCKQATQTLSTVAAVVCAALTQDQGLPSPFLVYESAPLLSDPEYQLFFLFFFREASKGGRKTGGGEAFKNQSRNT